MWPDWGGLLRLLERGEVANTYGYGKIYDLQLLNQVEKTVLPRTADPAFAATVPFPYLPVFILPFQALCRLSPTLGFLIWTGIKVAALIMYLRFLSERLGQGLPSNRQMLMVFTALPVFWCLFSGQVDVWLVICVGEFMRALKSGKRFRAGVWLGGLLIKPQVLVLIGLILLLQRSGRVLLGLAACGLTLVTASLGLIGSGGLFQVLRLWVIYARGQESNWIEGMMNWRMLGSDLSTVAGPWIGWGLAAAGMATMLVVTLLLWRHPSAFSAPQLPIAMLGILAATTSFAWHSHIWTAMMLIPPILYLQQANILPAKAVAWWIFLPAALFFFAVFAQPAVTRFSVNSQGSIATIYFFIGAGEFAVNQYLFWWAVSASRQRS